jgi:hypothetical protein
MRDVDHTHPHTGEAFGFKLVRGGRIVTDGGEAESEAERGEDAGQGEQAPDGAVETMADVDHDTHDGAARTYERGTEGRETRGGVSDE